MDETKKEKRTKWLGGEIRWGKRGPSYVIDRWVNGRHWHLSTKCRTEKAALKELELFEMAPTEYRRARSIKSTGLEITPELIAEYLAWMTGLERNERYIGEHERFLGEIMVALEGRDLSRVGFAALRDIIFGLGAACRWNRVKAIKAFATWLRQHKAVLLRKDDPTLDLKLPAPTPEKHRRRKAMDAHLVEKAIPLIEDKAIADIAIALRETGCHISEMLRFAEGGDRNGGLFERADWQPPEVLGNLLVRHKTDMRARRSATHVVAIADQRAWDALKRIKARGEAPTRSAIQFSDLKVTAKLGVKFSMGWNRHSVATWLAMDGRAEGDIANLLGQKSTKMAKQVYIDLGMSAKPVPIPKLKLVKG
jgi:hypothetical protein